jgi:hypothetical protein
MSEQRLALQDQPRFVPTHPGTASTSQDGDHDGWPPPFLNRTLPVHPVQIAARQQKIKIALRKGFARLPVPLTGPGSRCAVQETKRSQVAAFE